jgi:hypothetical protein
LGHDLTAERKGYLGRIERSRSRLEPHRDPEAELRKQYIVRLNRDDLTTRRFPPEPASKQNQNKTSRGAAFRRAAFGGNA